MARSGINARVIIRVNDNEHGTEVLKSIGIGLISEDDGEHFAVLKDPLISADAHGVRNIMSVSMVRLPKGEILRH